MILMNMFSSFDPSSFKFPFHFSILLVFYLMSFSTTKMMVFKKTVFMLMMSEIKSNFISSNQKSSSSNFISVFFVIAILNLGGLLPSSFSLTTQISLNLSVAITLWVSTNFFSFNKSKEKVLSHMVPNETPMILAPFMVLIELVSSIIRPITLSVRLTANMVAGHILILLLEQSFSKSVFKSIVGIVISMVLILLELGVSIIQSYVFSMLLSLYFSENH